MPAGTVARRNARSHAGIECGNGIRLCRRSNGARNLMAHRIAQPGDVYWLGANPVAGRKMKNRHRLVVITLRAINALGVAMLVPVTSGGDFARNMGLAVPLAGAMTNGVAVCNRVRSFDLEAREKAGSARYLETLDAEITNEIISRVLSVIDPGS